MVDQLGFAPMAVCANGAVVYDPSVDRIVSARTLSADALGELAEIATRVIPGAGLAVERVGRSAHDAATPQFVSSPGYEHAWLNPDNTEVSIEDLLSAPAVKLLIRKSGARSADMARVLAEHVGTEGDITYSTNNGLIEIVPLGVSKATGIEELSAPARHRVGTGGHLRRHAQRRADAGVGGPGRGDGQRPPRRARRRRRGDGHQCRGRRGPRSGAVVAVGAQAGLIGGVKRSS